MYLSRLYIKNYRSIKEIDLEFKKGKNVIVGRNNAGKSNIIKALDLVLGENSPTYNKSENITELDFFKNNTDEPIYIFCELTKNIGESFDFTNVSKNAIFSVLKNDSNLITGISDIKNYGDLEGLFLFETEDGQALFDDRDSGYKKRWIGGKSYCGVNSFDNEFNNTKKIMLGFTAQKIEGKLFKNLNFLYSNDGLNWSIGVNCGILRNIFLQSAIIPAFRDTNNQLKISNYSWYGKLLKNYIKSDNTDLLEAFENVKIKGQTVFNDMQTKIGDTKINIAFPNTKISFQFNPEKQDIHKNTQIYIDDGFNSPLQDKGSGIQSAVVIGLFDFYVRNIAHSGSSLLAIEEPELYLHPHGRRVISDRLNDFLDEGKNQVIIATHSTEFIVPLSDDLNIIVLRKDNENGTKGKNIDFSGNENLKRKQILIKKEVAEMFFADCVILTEDCKHYIEETAKKLGELDTNLGKHWLNNNNISVLNCGGKSWFHEYKKLLDFAEIPNYILADFDYLRDGGIENILEEPLKTELTTLKSQINNIHHGDLEIDFDELKEKLACNDFGTLKNKFDEYYKEIKKRCSNGNYKKIDEIDSSYHSSVLEMLEKLKEKGIFLLKGELENNYISGYKPKKSKEGGVIETICKLMEENKGINDFLDLTQLNDFLTYIIEKQNIIIEEQ